MKSFNATIIQTILLSIVLLLTGQFFYGEIFVLIVPKVDGGVYQVTKISGQFWTSLLFAFTLALTPFFILLTWRFSPIITANKKILTILIVIACMAFAILIRQQMIESYFNVLIENLNTKADKIQVMYPVDELYFEYFIFGGLCIGCILSYFLFRQKSITGVFKPRKGF